MNVSSTLKATLSILTILAMVHLFTVLDVHQSPSERVFVDHRHLEGNPKRPRRRPKPAAQTKATSQSRFDPIIIQSAHLAPLHLPEALRHPLRFNASEASKENPMGRCCQMASAKRTRKAPPKNIQCEGVCHTERACADELYPFASAEEARFFRAKVWNASDILGLRQRCMKYNLLLRPPYEWCRQWMAAPLPNSNGPTAGIGIGIGIDAKNQLHKFSHKNIHPHSAKLPPPGCSLTSEGGGSGSYQHLTLFPSAKLAFCGIPKVSITQWLQFLRFTFGAKDYSGFPHAKPDVLLMRFDKLEPESQRSILNDPEWKFAAFLRNPAERLLSAYLDKVNGKNLRDRDHFAMNYNLTKTLGFEEFVKIIAMDRTDTKLGSKTEEKLRGVDWFADPHWRPQSFSCGMSEFLPRFSYIGSLDRIEHQARKLLQEVGLWDDYGRYYHRATNTDKLKHGICSLPPPELSVGDELLGFLQLPREKNETRDSDGGGEYRHSHHSTGSQSKLGEYYTPELRSLVEDELYAMDSKLWKLIENEEDLVSGSDLAMKISEKCKRRANQLLGRG